MMSQGARHYKRNLGRYRQGETLQKLSACSEMRWALSHRNPGDTRFAFVKAKESRKEACDAGIESCSISQEGPPTWLHAQGFRYGFLTADLAILVFIRPAEEAVAVCMIGTAI